MLSALVMRQPRSNSYSMAVLLVVVFVILVSCQDFNIIDVDEEQLCCSETTTSRTIVDDATLTGTLTKIRTRFMSKRPYFDILNVVVLIPDTDDDNVFLRGQFGGSITSYPASVVKFLYFLSALSWCVESGRSFDCLDSDFRALIEKDSNWDCGVVVDAETNSTNIPDLKSYDDPRWAPWLQKRNFTQRFFDGFGLLKNQVMMTKTYPTNSGPKTVGAELLLFVKYGSNHVSPCCTGLYLFDVIFEGRLLPSNSSEYAKSLLKKEKNLSPLGHGLPAGTLIIEKDGGSFPWLGDTAYFELPNGRTFFLSFFSDALKSHDALDYGLISYFVLLLIQELGYDKGLPPQLVIATGMDENEDGKIVPVGDWYRETAEDMLDGSSFFYLSRGVGTIEVFASIPESGTYEISMYVPTIANPSESVKVTIFSSEHTTVMHVNQRIRATYYELGEFFLESGLSKVVEVESPEGGKVAVNAIKLSKEEEGRSSA